jgi:hypothetical protein
MDRFKEPSTWAGLAVLAAQAGKLVAPQWAAVFDIVSMLAGGAAVVKREAQ